jgi:hypothetical protein
VNSEAGAGQIIAVAGESDINISDIEMFRSTFQLPTNDPQLVLAGDDPGLDQGALLEADADLEWVGAVGVPVTFTAKVSSYNGNIPVGTVVIRDADSTPYLAGGTPLDASGTAVVTETLSPGPHSIVAQYLNGASTTASPGARFMVSTSAPISVMVVPPAPPMPVLASPANAGQNVSVSTNLTWNSTASYATYDVYLGTVSPPPYWGTIAGTQCSPSGLATGTVYYWMVIATNSSGSAASTIWSFTTSGQTVYRLSLIAGTGQTGFSGDGGPALNAQFGGIYGVAFDAAGDLFVGVITTVAGNGAIQDSGERTPFRVKRHNPQAISPAGGDLGALKLKLERVLMTQGLFPKEAHSMVETWRDSWFEEGVLVLYIPARRDGSASAAANAEVRTRIIGAMRTTIAPRSKHLTRSSSR